MNSSSSNNSCYHCGSFILPDDSYELMLGTSPKKTSPKKFCCAGCMAVAQMIHGEGLEVFYARRAQSSDKPADSNHINWIRVLFVQRQTQLCTKTT